MIQANFQGIAITGLTCCVPENVDTFEQYRRGLGDATVDRFIDSTGVKQRYVAKPQQTASDLAYVAAEKMLREKGVDASKIGALIFVTETPDYRSPATAFVLQARLGLPVDCACFDINLGCSGFVYGLYTLSALMANSNIQSGLLLFGDTMTKYVAPMDKSACMLFGDAGGAALLEKRDDAPPIRLAMRSDGYNFKSVMVEAGAFRNMDASRERVMWEDGNMRSHHDFYMDGGNVFSFSTFDVPALIKEFMVAHETTEANYDGLLLHQANRFILQRIAKRLKFPMEKVPLSMCRYGNTSGASIPVAATDAYGGTGTGLLTLLLCGFGVGLSWAVADLTIKRENIFPMIFSNQFYTEGGIALEKKTEA